MSMLLDNVSLVALSITLTATALTAIAIRRLGRIVVHWFATPLRLLPGPPSEHWFYGNSKSIFKAENSVLQEQWVEKYGPTLSYPGLFGVQRLWTMDTRALNHVLTHSNNYQKSPEGRFHLSRIVGPGLLVTEEEQHRHQRRVMNPAFGPAQIRELTEIFVERSQSLRERWLAEIVKSGSDQARIDVLSWLSKATLDIIGLAGFNYNIDALNPDGQLNELNKAFNTVFNTSNGPQLLGILQAIFPFMRVFKTAAQRRSAEAQKTMRRIGLQLIAEKKASIIAASGRSTKGVEKKDVVGRDLLTLLIKANMAMDIPESQRLTDEEVLAQVPTFIVAGHETTSTATMWALFALTQHPNVQQKLRDELFTVATENPNMDELSALPYLDMVVKEVMRFHSPVPMTMRTAMNDDVIPLNTPFVDRHGVTRDSVRIRKDDVVSIPIKSINRYKPLWGDDAYEFKPERWENPPDAVAAIPGVWGNVLSFLGGPRSCIGYRFSLVEMKALLFTLVRSFEFELAVPPEKVTKRSTIVQRPVILDEGENTNQMPLIVRQYVRM